MKTKINKKTALDACAKKLLKAYDVQYVGLLPVKGSDKFVEVACGEMNIVSKDAAIYTAGLVSCAALLIEGRKGKALVHMIAGKDSQRFGYWASEGFDPVLATLAAISRQLGDKVGKKSTLKYTIVANEGLCTNQQVLNLITKLKKRGVKKIATHFVPFDNTLLYSSAHSLVAIGTQDGEVAVKHCR